MDISYKVYSDSIKFQIYYKNIIVYLINFLLYIYQIDSGILFKKEL